MQRVIRLGTRGSKLALAQATIVKDRLMTTDPLLKIEIVTITTTGDKDQKSSLSRIGGKGVFIREIEQALLDERIDIAVHSFKDITVNIAEDSCLSGFLKPESVCDVLISRGNVTLENLPCGAKIGTGSMRRRALIKILRNDIEFIDIRGNVDTRLSKLQQSLCDGIVLSDAGLIRLGIDNLVSQRFNPETFVPAPGQGVIALQTRKSDARSYSLCQLVGDQNQRVISNAEFSALMHLGFDCRTPLGIYSRLVDDRILMKLFFVPEKSTIPIVKELSGKKTDPILLGKQLADSISSHIKNVRDCNLGG